LAALAPNSGELAKQPFAIGRAVRKIRAAVRPFPPAALFELHDEGWTTPFQQLVACILSIRTRDEVMIRVARTLFRRAATAAEIVSLSVDELDGIIHDSSFHSGKAANIHAIAQAVVEKHGGALPCNEAVMLGFRGVGPKCTNLVLGIACAEPRVGVDVHVHRITNRWGYVDTRTPEQTTTALEKVLPRRYRVEINRLLVPFGKHICTGRLPHCSTCPVLDMCEQVGVEQHR
jgi:endonuclease-3